MGNNEGKLRNFNSLPAENFPSLRVDPPSDGRSGSDRVNLLAKYALNGYSAASQNVCRHRVDYDPSDDLFLPVYSRDSHISSSDFKVEGVIAAGAFGDVVKVQRKKDGSFYAMKIMDKKRLVAEGAVQQSKDEATIQDSVGYHPFVVKPFWFFQSLTNIYIVMEYIPCGELFALWKKLHNFSDSLVQVYVAELGMVLDFLHKSGIIYRDLKMENILLDERGHLHVTDFGLAKRLKIGQRTNTICGTLQYIAPEIATMYPYGHASDWWSLGILMYALLVGQFPVSGASDHVDMSVKMACASYRLPSSVVVSTPAQHCLAKLLEKSPQKRLRSIESLRRLPYFKDVNFDGLYHRQVRLQQLLGGTELQHLVCDAVEDSRRRVGDREQIRNTVLPPHRGSRRTGGHVNDSQCCNSKPCADNISRNQNVGKPSKTDLHYSHSVANRPSNDQRKQGEVVKYPQPKHHQSGLRQGDQQQRHDSRSPHVYDMLMRGSVHGQHLYDTKNDSSTDHFAWKQQIASQNGMLV